MAPSTKLVVSAAPPGPYSTAEVARLLGRSSDRLLRNLNKLHQERGLPLPLAGRPYRWDRAAVDRWRAGTRPPPPAANDETAADAGLEDWRRALAAAYGRPK